MRKILAIILLSTLFISLSGYFLVYQYQRKQVRLDMRAYLRNNHSQQTVPVEKLSFLFLNGQVAATGFEWMNDHEFEYKGELYDVIRQTVAGDSLLVECINDESETILVKKFEAIFKKQSGDPVKGNAALIQMAHSVYVESIPTYEFGSLPAPVIYTGWITTSFSLPSREILTPPPRKTAA